MAKKFKLPPLAVDKDLLLDGTLKTWSIPNEKGKNQDVQILYGYVQNDKTTEAVKAIPSDDGKKFLLFTDNEVLRKSIQNAVYEKHFGKKKSE